MPRSRSPSVTPVAQKKTFSPRTSSLIVSTWPRSCPASMRFLPLLIVAGPQPPLQLAANALQCAGRDDALRGSADADQQVHPGVFPGGGNSASHVAIRDEFDERPASRTSPASRSWRGRSRTQTVTSSTPDVFHLRHPTYVFRDGSVRSTTPAASGPTASFSI